MPIITESDVTFTLSGGVTNTNPDESLGGEASSELLLSQRLFADVSPTEMESGKIDYRCYYVHNNGLDSLYNSEIYLAAVVDSDVTVTLGFYTNDEVQTLTVLDSSTIASGSLTLTYTGIIEPTEDTPPAEFEWEIEVDWDADVDIWADNLQTALRTIPNLEDVEVSATAGDDISFEISFTGVAGHRFHELLVVTSNDLSPEVSVGVVRTIEGGPINSVTTEIDAETTFPNGISFMDADERFELGEFRPLDFIPIWVKRTIPAGATGVANDGFTFRLAGTPIE